MCIYLNQFIVLSCILFYCILFFIFAIFAILCQKNDEPETIEDFEMLSKRWLLKLCWLICIFQAHRAVDFFSLFSTFVTINHYNILIKFYRSSNSHRRTIKEIGQWLIYHFPFFHFTEKKKYIYIFFSLQPHALSFHRCTCSKCIKFVITIC